VARCDPLTARLIRIGSRRVLVAPVNTRQYGHMALEILTALTEARAQGASLYWVLDGRGASPGLATLGCPDVPVVESLAGRVAVGALHSLDRARRRAHEWWLEAIIEIRLQARHEFRRPQYPRELALWLKDLGQRPTDMPWRRGETPGPYMRRKLLRYPVPVLQREPFAREARARAQALGIADGQPLVALHVREAGFKLGREMHNAKANARDDSSRNARIESFHLALDLLGARGFKVVRIGDDSMTPYDHPALVDLTRVSPYDSYLEVHCLLRSRFLIAGEAGPSGASYLTNTPLLTVNATDPISSFPIRRHGLFVLKKVLDRAAKRLLRLDELLTEEYSLNLRNTTRYQYIDNTPEEIVAAVEEMLDDLDHDRADTKGQTEFREAVTATCVTLSPRHAYVRKWGTEDGVIGDGRLARCTIASWQWDRAGLLPERESEPA
jgi:putative glycosyltransferase (TIGR04372 family)